MWLMHSKPMLVFCCLPRPPRGPAAAARLVPSSMGLGHRWMQKKAVLRGGRKEHDPDGCCPVVAGEGAGVSPHPTAPRVPAVGLVVAHSVPQRAAAPPRLQARPAGAETPALSQRFGVQIKGSAGSLREAVGSVWGKKSSPHLLQVELAIALCINRVVSA